MARVYDRPDAKNGKYRFAYIDEDGKRRFKTGSTDKRKTQEMADLIEHQARLVREGLVDRGAADRKKAANTSPAVLLKWWQDFLVSKGSTAKHARHQHNAASKLLTAARLRSVSEFDADALAGSLAAMKSSGKSARTVNHALQAVKSFFGWLDDTGRIQESPRALRMLKPSSERADVRYARRAMTPEEVAKLLAAAENGPDQHVYGKTRSKLHAIPITGPARALLYRIAMATGFRANELRSLTPESFDFEKCNVTILAAYSKNKKTAVQPIPRDLADRVRAWLESGAPLPRVPEKTAKMLRRDLDAAGVPYRTPEGVVDFHATRVSFITLLVAGGANPKVVQELARHSTITLTMDRYCKTTDGEKRKAVEGDR